MAVKARQTQGPNKHIITRFLVKTRTRGFFKGRKQHFEVFEKLTRACIMLLPIQNSQNRLMYSH